MRRLRILADDLTGALDSAAAFGAGVPVHLAVPAVSDPQPVSVLATDTRDRPVAELSARLAPALHWLAGADLAFKKVDSLLRGNTFDEVALAARAGRYERVVFAPAFPSQGRITRGARQWLQQEGADAQPVDGPDIATALRERGFAVETGAGPPPEVGVAWVPDVQDDADLRRVAGVARSDRARHWLWCGSAGLARALADGSPRGPDVVSLPPARVAGACLLVSGSWQPASRRQWAVLLEQAGPASTVHAGDPRDLVVAVQAFSADALGLFDLAPAGRLSAEDAAALLQEQAGLIARLPPPRALIVVGGDTLLALCRATGVTGLRTQRALPRSGWGSATLIGGAWHGTRCHTRSGAFGTDDDLLEVLRAVR